MKKQIISTFLGMFLLSNGVVFAGFNSPSHLSVRASAKVTRYKARIWAYQYQSQKDSSSPRIFGGKRTGECGQIKILAEKGKDIIVLGDLINLARCRKHF